MNIIGYRLSIPDNDTYMCEDDSNLDKCPVCGYRIENYPHNPQWRCNNPKTDISATYDGQWVVSKKMRSILVQECPFDVDFIGFESTLQYFHLIPKRIIAFDFVRRKTRFEKQCEACGRYESVVGAKPAFLVEHTILSHGFYGSDLFFGSGNERHNLLFVSATLKSSFIKSDVFGVDYDPVYL